MNPPAISDYVLLMYCFQQHRADINALLTDPQTQESVQAKTLVFDKQKHNLDGSIATRYWTFKKTGLPQGVRSIYFFAYGGETPREHIHVTFSQKLAVEGLLDYLIGEVDLLSIHKDKNTHTLLHDGEAALTTRTNSSRFILHPHYLDGEKKKYEPNIIALKMIDFIDEYRELSSAGGGSLSMTMGTKTVMVQTMNIWQEMQRRRHKALESKVLKANDHELRGMMDHYFF